VAEFWCASLAALAVREALYPAGEIDPATFD
jgi:hypothetical protein